MVRSSDPIVLETDPGTEVIDPWRRLRDGSSNDLRNVKVTVMSCYIVMNVRSCVIPSELTISFVWSNLLLVPRRNPIEGGREEERFNVVSEDM
jgi:hypothetical protein